MLTCVLAPGVSALDRDWRTMVKQSAEKPQGDENGWGQPRRQTPPGSDVIQGMNPREHETDEGGWGVESVKPGLSLVDQMGLMLSSLIGVVR